MKNTQIDTFLIINQSNDEIVITQHLKKIHNDNQIITLLLCLSKSKNYLHYDLHENENGEAAFKQ